MKLDKKGSILITSLWILIILSILALGIGFRVSIEARLSKYNMDRLRALYLAKAGVVKAEKILLNNSKDYDSIRECGITLPIDKDIKSVFTGSLDDGKFEVSYDEDGVTYYGMTDEERKININKADKPVLVGLLGGKDSEEVAESIINWRSNANMRLGAGDEYYKTQTPPYECKHAEFSVIEELLLVKGMTPELFASIKGYITVYGDKGPEGGKVNINTASKKVMLAFGLDEVSAETIIVLRNGIDKIAGTKDDFVFPTVAAALRPKSSLDTESPLEKYFTIKSNYFRIESKGTIDRSKISSVIACVLDKGAKKLIYYREY